MGLPGGPELLIVLVIVMLVFGASRLPKLARSMGQAGKEFKSGLKEGYTETEGVCKSCDSPIGEDDRFCPSCGTAA
jgi:sec-independent protein translocase protein TatA